ncbi:MAG: cation:proton antiporter [Anaerolineae bacterium]|jgi:Kef-type K+ transport system membrane component KefB
MHELLGIHFEPNILAVIGLIIAVSFLGSKLFQRFGVPQVVGFIVIGVVLGPSVLNLVPLELSNELIFISEIALGLIGFDIGSHLLLGELRRLGRSILFILLFEAVGTFLLVAGGIYLFTQSLHTALIFGALASATAPAATVDVLAEYDAKGPLTTTLLAVVGMDDALALVLFSLAAALAESLLAAAGPPSWLQVLELPLIEIGGSLVLGVGLGLLLDQIMCRMKVQHDAMAVSIGFVFLGVGISEAFGFSLILTTMILGMVVVNRCPEHGRHIRYTIEQAGPVIYVLFFTLVGARFQISLLPTMGLLGVAYVLLRSGGKFFGAWLGGTVGGAEPAVRNNLGLGLLSQAGVAIGLALSSANRFSGYGEEGQALGALIINVITATTFVVQIVGPISVKFAISRAGEIGRAALEHDAWVSEGSAEGPHTLPPLELDVGDHE